MIVLSITVCHNSVLRYQEVGRLTATRESHTNIMTLVRFYCSRRKLYRSYVCRYLRTGGGALSIESIFMIVNLGSVINCGSLASSFEIHPSRINLTLITSNQSSHLRQRNESVFTFTIGNLCVFSLG